jgi:catalase
MGDAPQEIKIRHISHCLKADSAYGAGVANALGIAMSDVPK